jgi:putative membrane protein
LPPVRITQLNRIFMLTTFGVYAWIYPSSVILVMFDRVPAGAAWMASFSLIVGGLVAASWVGLNFGLKRGLAASLSLLGLALAVEAVGVASGFPFGRYSYSEVLAPKLIGVPLGITFAWLMVVMAAFFTSRYLLHQLRPAWNTAALVLIATGLVLASDFLMEPVAVYVQGYWTWTDRGFYYGVPEANFIAWGVISLGMVYLLDRLTASAHPALAPAALRFRFIPPALYLMNLAMFSLVNFSHRNYLAGSIGLLTGAGCLYLIIRAIRSGRARAASLAFPALGKASNPATGGEKEMKY